MDDYRDLFVDDVAHLDDKRGVNVHVGRCMNTLDGVLSDPESAVYTTSESELEIDDRVRPWTTFVNAGASTNERELALHSPGKLLGTPRDPSRRYEYPFPQPPSTPSSSSHSTISIPIHPPTSGRTLLATGEGLSALLSPASTTPGLTPPLASSSPSSSSLGLLHTSTSSPTLSSLASFHAGLSHIPSRAGSPPLVMAIGTAAHPKLLRFNPADAPVPPKLRNRTTARKSHSIPVPPVDLRDRL